ncbi:hypothetical protein HYALB_00011002 [Hymenoscyphus albidus]|uniref:NmrA-like domain-containing protein n=1 Tax=Hymenoscyphus albidus TaxID=595503 RepID=A0A9N9LNX8_9HELO|nr:hypothetical protein HYALB_00011002 [Hymenoscyphus albidus]
MLALTSPTGKLGAATLSSLLTQNLIPLSSLILLTSTSPSSPKLSSFHEQGIQIRQVDYKNPTLSIFHGITKLLLISTPEISLDFNCAPTAQNPGRESVHIPFLRAAVEGGVKHLFYTSLAFGDASKSGVMRAHLRTEEFLRGVEGNVDVTVIREGLYNESWPLYLGYFETGKDERDGIVIGGDGKVCWTCIADLGLGTAMMLSSHAERFRGRTVYLSSGPEGAKSLRDVAGLVGRARGRELGVRIVVREEFVRYYVEERGGDEPSVEWWSTTYDALEDGECLIDDMTLTDLLKERGLKAKTVEETISEMLGS